MSAVCKWPRSVLFHGAFHISRRDLISTLNQQHWSGGAMRELGTNANGQRQRRGELEIECLLGDTYGLQKRSDHLPSWNGWKGRSSAGAAMMAGQQQQRQRQLTAVIV
jgi:hypothetical protein